MGLGVTLSVERYLVGFAAVALVVGVLAWGAYRVRRVLLPDWSGPPARLAETVIALGAQFVGLYVLGSVGGFRPVPVLIVLTALGVALGYSSRWYGRLSLGARVPPATRPVERWCLLIAAGATALVAAQWAGHVGYVAGRGMTHVDTLIYHMPAAAMWLQEGRFGELDVVGVQQFYPYNAELLHGIAAMAFGRDVLSPLLNIGWGAVAALAAWCIGRSRGGAPLALLGLIVVAGLPALTGTQPGQASTDIASLALLLVSVALLVEGDGEIVSIALAGVAAGLALSTKLTVGVPVIVLTIGVAWYGLRSRRLRLAGLWCVGLAVTGVFWFLRNWVLSGSPVPWTALNIGPLSMPSSVHDFSGRSVMTYITEGEVWRDSYFPGLSRSFGAAWPLILIVGIAGCVIGVLRGSTFERVAALSAIAGMLYYPFSPLSADGHGIAFQYTLRYLTPALAIGVVLFASSLARAHALLRGIGVVGLAALVVVNAISRNGERVPAWPSGQLAAVIVTAAVVLLTAAVIARGRFGTRAAIVAVSGITLCAVAGGWVLQQHYLEHRYINDGTPGALVDAYFHDVHGARVAELGGYEVFALYGADLSNRVERIDQQLGAHPTRCEIVQRLSRGGFDFVVVAPRPFGTFVPLADWLTQDGRATQLLADENNSLFRINSSARTTPCS
ncbi:MAG: hypothetical protein QOC79_436 [Actinomycetota bacterium]|nr:hypothetical protein [Actinomycetota bacterium]